MFVLTVDQIDSGSNPDRVPEGVAALNALDPIIAFERTVGDEFQGAFEAADDVVRALLALAQQDCWHIGLGIGEVEKPLPKHSREGDGPAYRAARRAVDLAKRQRAVTFEAGTKAAAEATANAQAIYRLMAALLSQRTERQWELAALAETETGAAIAKQQGITPQTVSAVLKSGHAREIDEARPVLARLLHSADIG